jgi:MFS family permease
MQVLNKKQQILVLISGLLIELIIGSVYAYSVVRLYLENELNLTHTQSSIPYLTSLAVFALMVMLSGRFMRQSSFHLWAILGILSIGSGFILSAFSSHYLLFTLTYGVMIGSGVGILYGIPIQVIQTVYEKNKGTAVGMTIAGFGLSTVIIAPLLQASFQNLGFQSTLIVFGIGSAILLSIFLKLLLIHVDISKLYLINKRERVRASKSTFALFFVIFTLGIMFGLSMIGLTVYIGLDYYNLELSFITLMVSLFALFNGLSRPLFGFIYDKFKLKKSVIFISLITLFISSSYVFLNPSSALMFVVTISLSWATVGGWLSMMPSITRDLFGQNNFNRQYGKMYLSYGVAAIIGNLYTSILIDQSISLSIIFIPIIVTSILIILAMSVLKIKLAKQ